MRNKKGIVLGANGFIGSHLVQNLLNQNWDVWAVTRGYKQFLFPIANENLKLITADDLFELVKKKLNRNTEKITIFHLAAQLDVNDALINPEKLIADNFAITLQISKLLRLCKKNIHMIYISTDRVFGGNLGKIVEDDIPCPIDPYGLSKYLCEELIKNWSKLYSIKSTIVRCTNIYGPFQKSSQFIPSLFQLFFNEGNDIKIGNLNQNRSFLYIDDAIEGLLLLTNNNLNNNFEIFHLAGTIYSLKDIADKFKIIAELRFNRRVQFVKDASLVRLSKNEMKNIILSISKIKKKLGWFPKIDIESGLENIFNKQIINNEK